ncbi:MAG: polysaccharide ABC transporter ATP-binding protein, partial [Nitrospirota bacterium]|nr:polysaccharide ABC transporter ATP-binding protein [Nitrospirota bacterium]
MNIISVNNISKQYHIGTKQPYKTLRESIMNTLAFPARFFSRNSSLLTPNTLNLKPDADTFWALKDVSFEVQQGEVIGIIGRNGAGKTTLLKILSRVTEPTEGEVRISGRVASLLEVGTGFHPELTGRENIYLNGAILGMSRAEIKSKFDEIVAFAEIEKFLDTPVKRYSSGMYVRLAFAVAAHLEPEILVVDEVLAVGDAQFQKKCLGKMGEVAKGGRTVLFVSHNMGAVERLCTRAILLDHGTITQSGPVHGVVSAYLQSGMHRSGETTWKDPKAAPGDDVVRLRSVRAMNAQGQVSSDYKVTEPISIGVEFEALKPGYRLDAGFQCFDESGNMIFQAGDFQDN